MTPEGRRPPADYWAEIPPFYRELIDHYHWKQGPMLELVEGLTRTPWAHRIYPSTSHEALGLSLHERHDERRKAPMVYVRYNGNADTFDVVFQQGQGSTVSTETHGRLDDRLWERIRAWIDGVAA